MDDVREIKQIELTPIKRSRKKIKLTTTEARLHELLVYQWSRHMLMYNCSIPDLLFFVRMLSRMFGTFSEEAGNKAMSRIVSDPLFGGTIAEFWSCLWQTGYVSDSNGYPSYTKCNRYARMTRAMYRKLVSDEKKHMRIHMPKLPEGSEAVTTGILLALYSFDKLGIAIHGGARSKIRRFYPAGITDLFTHNKPVEERADDEDDRYIEPDWEPSGQNATREQGAGKAFASEEERQYWRDRIRGPEAHTAQMTPDSLLGFAKEPDEDYYDFTE